MQGIARGGKQGLLTELQKKRHGGQGGVARAQGLFLLLQLLRGLQRLLRMRAPALQRRDGVRHLVQRAGIEPLDLNAEPLQLIDLALRIAAAPGKHHIRLQRQNALDLDALPVGDLFQRFRGGRIVGPGADRDRRDAGGERHFGEMGGERDNARSGGEQAAAKQQQPDRPERFSHAPGAPAASPPSATTAAPRR